MRFVDILLSIPSLLLAVSVAAVIGRRPISIMIAVAAAQVPIFARLLRGSMLGQRNQDYVLAAFSLGLRRRTIVMGHILPNSLESGDRPGNPGAGHGDHRGGRAVLPRPGRAGSGDRRMGPDAGEGPGPDPDRPAPDVLPGICIAITALGFTLLGEALREALDPKSRR